MMPPARTRMASSLPLPEPGASSPLLAGNVLGAWGGELKFLLDPPTAHRVEAWARERWTVRSAGEEARLTTLYLDTPRLEAARRAPGFRWDRYRLRQAAGEAGARLERKTRRGDRVRETALVLREEDLGTLAATPGAARAIDGVDGRVRALGLGPSCRVTFRRRTWGGETPGGAVLLVLDREVRGVLERVWTLAPAEEGPDLLGGRTLLELHFGEALPDAFRRLVAEFGLVPRRWSKYRRCLRACGALPPELSPDA